jgi:hypothetical protein
MYNKFAFLLPLLTFLGAYGTQAQTNPANNLILNQKSVKLNLGSQGIGGEFAYGVNNKVALRLGINIIPVSVNDAFEFTDFNSTSKVSAKFTNIHLLADYTPFKSAPAFRLVGGAAYFVRAKGGMHVQPSDNYTYGDIVLNEEQVGYLNMDIDWKGIAPYAGIGLFRVIPKHRFNVNLDLGTYYLKQPDVKIVGTGILKGNNTQEGQLKENVKDYRWLPVLQLNFSYKL